MKKLIMAMGAAAMFSLSASAADTLVSSVDFENLTAGTFDVNADDYGTEIYSKYWLSAGTISGSSMIVNGADAGNSNTSMYLSVDETDTLYRMVNERDATTTNTVSTTAGVYLQTKVQFTATDEDPTPETGDKILVWLQESTLADDTTTNILYVTANSALKDNTVTHYAVTNIEVNTTAWYTLEIRAEQDSSGYTVFTVSIDGTTVNDGQTFTSLVTSGDQKSEIAALGFKGTGNIDDLSFGTYDIAAAATFTLTATVAGDATDVGNVGVYVDGEDAGMANGTVDGVLCSASSVVLYLVDESFTTVTCTIGESNYNMALGEAGTDYDGLWIVTIPTEVYSSVEEVSVTVTATAATTETTYPDYIGTDDADAKAKYDAWASTYGVTDTDRTGTTYEAAYLLNVAPADATTEAEGFKITSITVTDTGVTCTIATTNGLTKTYNGTVKIKYCDTVNGTEWTEVSGSASGYEHSATDSSNSSATMRFYKAVLE